MKHLAIGTSAMIAVTLFAPHAWAQLTLQMSVASNGAQGNSGGDASSISARGRFVVFTSLSTNLVAGDTNSDYDVFVRDRQSGSTELVSKSSTGGPSNGNSDSGVISSDGRYVAFSSVASNLVPGDTNNSNDVFVRDRQLGTTERVSVDSSGAQANGNSSFPSISADGRFVAFTSYASTLVPGDTNAGYDIFVRDRRLGTTERVSVDSNGAQADGHSFDASITPDGRFIAFYSTSTNLVAGDTNGVADVFVRDRLLATTERASVGLGGVQSNGFSGFPSISGDGRFVAFHSMSTNLVAVPTTSYEGIYVYDRQSGTNERMSVDPSGADGNGSSEYASISGDGRYVAFESAATNLVPGDTNGFIDVFVRDRQLGSTARASVDSSGAQANGGSFNPTVSADGRYVSFVSGANNLTPGDTNGFADVFVRDRDASGMTSLCDPGARGVAACPCSNAPSSPGRGCDNSSATGGASLAASGIAYLTMDGLVFSTSGEKPTAPSILLQGNTLSATGFVFGQGVGCASGVLIRLYTKVASSGSITAPELGDAPVSSRSAALGDAIQAGQSRWYLVYYGDPIVLGGCSAASTFNATQSVEIAWSL